MKTSNHYMLYHSPWQPSGKAPVPYGSESLHTLPPAISPKPGLCSLHDTWEEMTQAEEELPKFLREEIQRKGVKRTKN